MNTYPQEIEAFRNRAEHFRAAARRVWDESSRASLLSLAADYEDRALRLEERMRSEQPGAAPPPGPKDGATR
jgi:hypothetical protein